MTAPNTSQPLVTIYMPTYNRIELLQRAVDSVLNQDYRNIELIVVDDSSVDGTHEYLTKMARQDDRFRYFINKENSGACVSRNKAIFAANGEFITGIDDDDYFIESRISDFVNYWYLKNDDCIALYSNNLLKTNDKTYRTSRKKPSCTAKDLILYNCIGNQIFTKTSYMKSISGFDDEFPAWQDLECWYRLLKTYESKAYCINRYSYVVDISHDHERISGRKKESILNAYNLFIEKNNLNKTQKELLMLQYFSYFNYKPSFKTLAKRIMYQPNAHNIKSVISTILYYKLKTYKNDM